MVGIVVGVVLIEAALVLVCWRWGYGHGVVDTERRWSDAVGRAEHSDAVRATSPRVRI